MIDKVEKTKCTGCKMCADVCPQRAIDFKTNSEGYWYPVCDSSMCNNCGLCLKKCPAANNNTLTEAELCEAYVAWSRNDEIRRMSTSGGLYYEFAKYFIEENGYILGSVYTDDYCGAYHTFSDSEEGLQRIMGSKYFQSDTGGVFSKTKELLMTGKKVLFTGTPCQVVALKNYLQKEYDNLYTLDFICRGVPSPLMQKRKIELYSRKARSKVVKYQDKSKLRGWSQFGELIYFENGKKKFISRWKDEINNCFIGKNLNLRESCYVCEVKAGKNQSDITIGDFWGIEGVTARDEEFGVSAMIVNSKKGKKLVEKMKERIYTNRRTVQEIIQGNNAYIMPAKRPEGRRDFFSVADKEGIEYAVNKYKDKGVRYRLAVHKRVLFARLKRYYPLIKEISQIRWFKFLYYNFFCKQIIRERGSLIYPYKGTLMHIGKNAKVIIKGDVFINYYPAYMRGNSQTIFQIREGACVKINNGLKIAYNNTFSVGENCSLEIGYYFTGVGANLVCAHKMTIGNNVMIGRDVCIFDSDYHKIYDENGERINENKDVNIGDNVWIGARSMVLKGSNIKDGAIVSANSMVMGDVEENRCFINKREAKSIGGNILWKA